MDGKLLQSIINVTLGCVFLVFFSALPSVPVGLLARRVAKKRGWRRSWPFTAVFFLAVATFFSYDIVITHVLAWRFCHSEPNPKTFVLRKAVHPGSIYFDDNVYPEYDEKDELIMIYDYLDLPTLALNDPDGNVHIYTVTPDDWRISNEVENRVKARKEAAEGIAARKKTYTRETMPKMNYTVRYDLVPLPDFWLRYVQADEMTITDNSTGEIIAYNRCLRRKFYRFEPNFYTHSQFPHGTMCGDPRHDYFYLKIFNERY